MSDPTVPHPTPCQHGISDPVICPQCDPEAYERARPQAEAIARKLGLHETTTKEPVPGGVAEFWRALAALSNNAADRERRLRFCREAEVAYGSGS